MTISIIIPIYNVEKYIEACLESVSMQTFSDGMECILIDDCGQDKSILIAEEYIRNYRGNIEFTILHHEKNKGLSGARNTGIVHARGEYIYFLDSDDTITPNCIELLVNHVSKNPNVDAVQGSINVNGKSWKALPEHLKREYSEDREWIRENLCLFTIPDPAWNRLVRTKFIKDNELYFAEGLIQEDTLWSYTLQKAIKSIAFCYEDTYIYRTNPEGIMNTNKGLKEASSFSIICNVVYSDLKKSKSIKPYEIKYLELNATRIGNAGGKDGLKMMNIYNNPVFRILHYLNSKYYTGYRWELFKGKVCNFTKALLRRMLCFRQILSIQ